MASKQTQQARNLSDSQQAWLYGNLGWPLAMLGIPIYLTLPNFYAENTALSLTTIGLILLLARSFDVITDPLIGWASDRLLPIMNRKIQIGLMGLLLIISVHQLWIIDRQSFDAWQLFLWSMLTYFAWSGVSIPYFAMAAEISEQDFQKSRLSGVREALGLWGVMFTLSVPVALGLSTQDFIFYETLFWLFAGLLLIGWLTLIPLPNIHQSAPPKHTWSHLKTLWQQHRYVFHIMPSYFFNNLANALPATLFVIFVSDYLQLSEHTGLFLLLYFICGILALPLWLGLSKKIGKILSWRVSMLWASLCFSGVFFLEPGDFIGFAVITVLTGLSLGIDLAIPASIQSDLAQKVEHRVAKSTGLLFGLWGLLTKLSLALAAGLALPLWELGKTSGLEVESLMILYAGLPILLKLIAWKLTRD